MAVSMDPQSGKGVIGEFVGSLTPEEVMLIVLKRQLYDGDWQSMLDDLENRLAGKPYVFKLQTRIKDDIARVEKLRDFEHKHHIDLADYVKLSV